MPEFLKPWRMALPTLGLLVLGLAWSGYWMWASSQAHARVAIWRGELERQGITITCGDESWGGYPFRVEVRCTPGEITRDGRAVQFGKLTVLAQAYDLGHILIVNDGETVLRLGDGQMRIRHEGAIASLLIGKKGRAQLDAEFKNISGQGFTAARFAFHARLEAKLDLAAALEGAAIQMAAMEPVSLDDVTLTGSLAPVPPALTFKDMAQTASTVIIDKIEVQSAAIRFTGAGDFMINPQALPEGKLKGRIENFDHVLQALADRGILEEQARMGAGAVLGLIGGNSPDGMRIDIAATQGGFYIGPFRIADLPPLY